MLYVVATPIGNLGDMSFRAVEVLKSCGYVLCEDTRHSGKLLHHFEIEARKVSYHKFNELERQEQVISDLKKGTSIALISDAGTPGIADPGQRLIERCHQEGLAVSVIPGACAAIVGVVASGLSDERFQFVGFLPKKEGERKKLLAELSFYPGVSICYESPKRLKETLKWLGDTEVTIARELTKLHEEIVRGKASEIEVEERGEMVLMIRGAERKKSLQDELSWVMDSFDLSKKEAIPIVAKLQGMPKRDLYKKMLDSDSPM